MVLGITTLENPLAVSHKMKLYIYPYDPVISFLGIYPKEMKTYVTRKAYTQILLATLKYHSQKPWQENG